MVSTDLKVGLLGGGSWGTTVASLTARNAHITLWARDELTVNEINQKHTNEKYLPGAKLSPSLIATNNIEEAVAPMDVIVWVSLRMSSEAYLNQ